MYVNKNLHLMIFIQTFAEKRIQWCVMMILCNNFVCTSTCIFLFLTSTQFIFFNAFTTILYVNLIFLTTGAVIFSGVGDIIFRSFCGVAVFRSSHVGPGEAHYTAQEETWRRQGMMLYSIYFWEIYTTIHLLFFIYFFFFQSFLKNFCPIIVPCILFVLFT